MNHCGSCTMCCKVMAIPPMDSPAGSWCKACKPGTGCTAYDARPDVCRGFECLWLQSQRQDKPMAANLRPDRSRVVLAPASGGYSMIAHVDPAKPDAWDHGDVRRVIRMLVAAGQPVAVCIGQRRIGMRGAMVYEWTEAPATTTKE